jgi:AcrR family transcriptional regulator
MGGRFQARKQAILLSAIAAINRCGLRGMTLAEVAASLDLVPTGVIYYFRNKEELAAACYLRGIGRVNALLETAAEASDAAGRIGALLCGFVDLKRAQALGEAEPLVDFGDLGQLGSSRVSDAYTDMFRKARGLLDGPETAGLSRLERNARAHLLISQACRSERWLRRSEPEAYPRAAARMCDIAVRGLAASGRAWAPTPLPPLSQEPASPTSGVCRADFLRAAAELINEQGYLGASVEKISARLKVTKGAFYHHNETKDDLLVACFEQTLQVIRTALRSAEERCDSALDRLASAACALAAHQLSGQAPLLNASALASAPDAVRTELAGRFERLCDRFADLISDGVADGSVRPVDAGIGAQMIIAMINSVAELPIWAPGAVPQSAAGLYVRPLFEGLFAQPEPVWRAAPGQP